MLLEGVGRSCTTSDCGAAVAHSAGDGDGLQWVLGDAERLPFADNSMDAYTIAFGIRNVTHIDTALAEAHRVRICPTRFTMQSGCSCVPCPLAVEPDGDICAAEQVLKKGGAFHCLEFSQLAVPGLRELYNAYSFNVIPQIGR